MHFNTINHFSGIQTVFAVTVLSPYSCLLFNRVCLSVLPILVIQE